jgi:sugar lactone lactonase YvrE
MNGYAAVFGNNSSGTAQFKFQTPFDFTSVYPVVVYKGQRNLSQDISNTIMDSIVSPDGKKLYELDYATDRLYEHDIKVPFDLRTARRTEGKLWVGGTSEPRGIGFGTDGKTLYWVAGNTGQIQEAKTSDDEDLYDIRTMSWSGITTTTVNTTGTQDFAFNNDGSKLYTLEITSDSIHERTLTYNGNIRVSSGATSYSFASDGLTEPRGMQFKSDGSSLFVVDNGTDAVYQYALTTSFAVDTISGLTTSFIVSNEAIQPYSLRFKPDGTKMFVLNYTGNNTGDEYKIYSYNLSSPWDLDTASYTGDSFKVRYKTFTPEGIEFSPDGKRLLVSSTYSDSIYQFELSIPWDITTATYETTTLDLGEDSSLVQVNNIARNMEMSPDGRTLIIMSQSTAANLSRLFQYQLKTPWRINTATYVSQYTFNPYANDSRYFTIGNAHFDWDNGDVYFMYRANSTINGQVFRSKLPEYKDDKTEVFGGLDVYGKTKFEGSIDVKEPSRFEYIGIGTDNESLRSQLTVSGNANLPSISPNEMDIENYYLNSRDYFHTTAHDAVNDADDRAVSNPYGLSFSPDGRYMHLTAGGAEESIYQYELSIPWDISTAKLEHGLWVASNEALADVNELTPRDVGFGSDGNYMYLVGQTKDTVFQWTLGTPYQINTAGFTTSFYVGSEEGTPQWVGFSTGGDRMYILGNSDEINEYSLSTPWFVDSASFDSNTALDSSTNETAGYIKPDGTKMWIIDTSVQIHEHNFGTPWDSSTLTISTEDSERYTGDANSLPFKELTLQKYGITAAQGLYFSPDVCMWQILLQMVFLDSIWILHGIL